MYSRPLYIYNINKWIDLFRDKITPAAVFYNNTYSTFTELEFTYLRIRKNDRTYTRIILKFNEIGLVVPHMYSRYM